MIIRGAHSAMALATYWFALMIFAKAKVIACMATARLSARVAMESREP
jgi:hypothetical protein